MPRLHAAARLTLALAVALAIGAVPIGRAAACSCAGFGTPEQVVAGSAVTFIGTVVDQAPGGKAEFGGSNVTYAFDVERASVPTDPILVVQSLDDPGGAACGFSFGMGERWLVATHRQGVALETNLCSGNQLVDVLPDADLEVYTDLLPNIPPDPTGPTTETNADGSVAVAIAIAVLGALVLGGITLLMFRERRVRQD